MAKEQPQRFRRLRRRSCSPRGGGYTRLNASQRPGSSHPRPLGRLRGRCQERPVRPCRVRVDTVSSGSLSFRHPPCPAARPDCAYRSYGTGPVGLWWAAGARSWPSAWLRSPQRSVACLAQIGRREDAHRLLTDSTCRRPLLAEHRSASPLGKRQHAVATCGASVGSRRTLRIIGLGAPALSTGYGLTGRWQFAVQVNGPDERRLRGAGRC